MLFNTLKYVLFLTIVFSVYWAIPSKSKNALLLVASILFCCFGGWQSYALLLSIAVISFFSAIAIEKFRKKSKRIVFLVSIFIILANLAFFKYRQLFASSWSKLLACLGFSCSMREVTVILPLGISFYSFQVLSYITDVFRDKLKPEHSFLTYFLFVIFFPYMLSGPICRGHEIIPQLKAEKSFDSDKALFGAKLILWGYFKKLVVADNLAVYTDKVYAALPQYHGFSLLLVTFFYAIQIYCDFSGYSDIAIGSAKLFGIELRRNFKTPYFSSSIKEFWAGWHISLSTWFRDYVYIPLGGSRAGKIREYFNLFVTFLVSGLWHGADVSFVVWGALHGLLQIMEKVFKLNTVGEKNIILRCIKKVLVFSVVALLWIPFRADSLSDALYVISNMWSGFVSPGAYVSTGLFDLAIGMRMLTCIVLFLLMPLFFYDFVSYKTHSEGILSIDRLPSAVRVLLYVFIGFEVVVFSLKGIPAEFVYLQF